MAKIWIKGFTRSDGTKVKGHYRDVEWVPSTARGKKTMANKIRLGQPEEVAVAMMGKRISNASRPINAKSLKKIYGQEMSRKKPDSWWVKSVGRRI